MAEEVAKLEIEVSKPVVGQEIVVSPLASSLDYNPAAIYLATLRPVGRRGMLHALNLIAQIAGGKDEEKGIPFHTALTFPWASLRYQHTAAIITALREHDYRPATINHALAALRGVLYQAWKLGQITTEDYNRAKDIKSVRGESLLRGRALPSTELTRLLEICLSDTATNQTNAQAGVRDAALIAVLYSAGLRRSEVVKLMVADYDSKESSLTVRGGKGGKDRMCYLAETAVGLLAEWLKLRGSEATGALFCPIRKGGHIAYDKGMTDQAVLTILKKRAQEAGVANFSPHDLRRTFISHLLDVGADIATVQKMAGHANITTTARYDRRGEEAKKKAATLLKLEYSSKNG